MSLRLPNFPVLLPMFCLLAATGTVSAQPVVPSFQRDDQAASERARGIAVADFNRDGWLDLVTANHGPHGIAVLLNRGASGGFTPSFIDIPGGPFDVETGDLNSDGVPDIAVAAPDSNSIVVVLGRPAGGFAAPVTVAPANSRGLTIADMDGDANLDLVYTHWDRASVQVLHGDGSGQFAARVPPMPVGINPQGVAAADFDLDGRMDLAVASSGSVGISILHQTAPDVFARSDVPGNQTSQNVIVAADLNRDGRPDIAAASTGTNLVTVHVFHGDSATTAVTQSGGSSIRGIDAADLNRDGVADIVVASRGTSAAHVLLYGNPDHGSFISPPIRLAAGAGSRAVSIADFDNDGRPDIATANEFSATATVLSNVTMFPTSAFAFAQLLIGFDPNGFTGSAGADVADFDRDGRLDIVTQASRGGLRVIFGDGSARDLPAALGPTEIRAANLNGDGFPDILFMAGTAEHLQLAAYLGAAGGEFNAAPRTDTGMRGTELATADLNRDGALDAVVTGFVEGTLGATVVIFHGRGDGTFTAAATLPREPRLAFQPATIGDVDRDGDADILTPMLTPFQSGATSITVWPNDGTGHFASPGQTIDVPGFEAVRGGALGDLDHDGWLDFVAGAFPAASTPQDRGVVIVRGSPDGFGNPSSSAARGPNVVLADMTLDGHLDAVNDAAEILHGNGDGTFGPPQAFEAFVPDPRIVDFNRDGVPDIVAAHQLGTAQILANRGDDVNHPPIVDAGRDRTVRYGAQFGDGEIELTAAGSDPDLHKLTYEWRDEAGTVFSSGDGDAEPPAMLPGTHRLFVTASDNRGKSATDSLTITVLPEKEVITHVGAIQAQPHGNWSVQPDSTAAGGSVLRDTQANLPKVTTPSANPSGFADFFVLVDPTQTYKLWVRLKADQDHWTNDSLWLQFDNAVDQNGRAYAPGTTSGIEVVLEECSGCGESGWGWRDDAWGQRGAVSALTLKFTQGGYQRVRIQTREDGVSIDQLVLSAEQFRTTRPGTVKNDTTIVPATIRP
jgi:hypothetical protein